MSDVAERADRLIRTVADGDTWGSNLLLHVPAADLAALALELAGRVTPADSEPEIVTTAIGHAAGLYGTKPADVLSGSRRREDVDARQVASYVARLLGCPYALIGRQLGRDHSTVISSCERVANSPRMLSAANRIAVTMGWDRNAAEAS